MDFTAARDRMVETQIAARGLADPRVLDAMRTVERHLFVSADLQSEAYADRPLPIGEGQTISQPYIVALMTTALAPEAGSRVLEIGTGSGYQTAILAHLSGQVVSIERHPSLAQRASAILSRLGVSNVTVIVGDGTEGYPSGAPFNRILVTAGAPFVPEALRAQLADRGRLVIPVGPARHQRLTIVEREGGTFGEREGESCVFVPLIGRHGWAGGGE